MVAKTTLLVLTLGLAGSACAPSTAADPGAEDARQSSPPDAGASLDAGRTSGADDASAALDGGSTTPADAAAAADAASSAPCPIGAGPFDDALSSAQQQNNGYGGAVRRIECLDGRLVWEGAAGNAIRSSRTAMTPDATFEIASTTKAITAIAALLLVEDGLLALDAPISAILPASTTDGLLVISAHDYGPELTLRQLLQHTSGLPDYWADGPLDGQGNNAFLRDYLADPQRSFTPEELLDYARDLSPIGLPGSGYHYSDTGYVLAGLMLEASTGKPLHEVYRERIFAPLALEDTYLTYHEAPTSARPSSELWESRERISGTLRQSADWAGGGLVSSTRDLAKIMRALAGGRILRDAATLDTMKSWMDTDSGGIQYGLGLFRVDYAFFSAPQLGVWWGHDGHGNSFMYLVEPQGLVFTGTLNQTEGDWGPMVENILAVIGR